jgi:serine/threonine-protein kinase RsbW
VIKSDISELKNVEIFVNEIFTECNISNKYFNKVYLCISEAVINSIEHGNKKDKNKKVSIIANYEENRLNIKVKDEGNGFNLKLVEDPTTPENIRKELGRGIFIIKSLSKQIEYNKKGNSIHFKIECSE